LQESELLPHNSSSNLKKYYMHNTNSNDLLNDQKTFHEKRALNRVI
jgi:hypothetical protein